MERERSDATTAGYAAYLSELKGELAALTRFPSASYPLALALGLSVLVLLGGFLGLGRLPVPGYIILPFVVIPGWRLARKDQLWQNEKRMLTERIRLVEERQRVFDGSAEAPGEPTSGL